MCSEQEWGGGFVDLYLAPCYARYHDMRHVYLIELKYLKRVAAAGGAGVFDQLLVVEPDHRLVLVEDDVRIEGGVVVNEGT